MSPEQIGLDENLDPLPRGAEYGDVRAGAHPAIIPRRIVTWRGDVGRGEPTDEARAERVALESLLIEVRDGLDGDPRRLRECLRRIDALVFACTRTGTDLEQRDGKGGLQPKQIATIVAYIDKHLGEPIAIDDMARAINLSRTHFCREFKRTTGQSPHQFVIGRRLALAQDLLLRSSVSLSQIARCCGFADQAHLTRTFRRFTGASPLRWKKNAAALPGQPLSGPGGN
ncbi:helix-turn-helix domain-containing protein [Sphingomonas glacialis]|nr:AraC family transcriptional regulator [Sphingomonas glacialis]